MKFLAILSACLLLASCCLATKNDGCPFPWENRRGDACYGNPFWYQHANKALGSAYVRTPGDLIYFGEINPSLPFNGSLPQTGFDLTRQVFANMLQLVEAAGGTIYDILRNPVRSNDTATLTNDPNNALVLRAGLANITEIIYDLKIGGNPANGPSYPIFPVDPFRRPPGRSYVIILQPQQVNMMVAAFVGSNRRCEHDVTTNTTCFKFNQLPFNWTALSAADQAFLVNNGYCLPNGTCFHYSSPTSLSYNPKFELCEDDPFGEVDIDGRRLKSCREYMLRSCERGFGPRVQDESLTIRNALGQPVGGVLNWKGQYYNCTDVVNYNNGGGLWCRIRDDVDIPVANDIVWSHHANAARMLGFQPSDDALLDFFYTKPAQQHTLNLAQAARRYAPGKFPPIVPQNGRLVGGDKQELTGEHITGQKVYSSEDPARRVTPASLEGWNTVRVGAEAFATTQSGHTCNATACRLPTGFAAIARAAFENAFADLRSVGHAGKDSVSFYHVITTESTYETYRPILQSLVAEFWPNPLTRPVEYFEPHISVYPYHSTIAGRSIEGPSTFSVFLRSVQLRPSRVC